MVEGEYSVVYFDQCLGAGHAKPWLKLAFLMFLYEKHEKKEEGRKMRQENYIWGACKQTQKKNITVSKRVYQGFQRFPPLSTGGIFLSPCFSPHEPSY